MSSRPRPRPRFVLFTRRFSLLYSMGWGVEWSRDSCTNITMIIIMTIMIIITFIIIIIRSSFYSLTHTTILSSIQLQIRRIDF